jgi:fusion and transport protein UGO1
MEESTRPDYVIPVGSVDGVWAMMKNAWSFRGEGWLALWKGLCPEHLVTRARR